MIETQTWDDCSFCKGTGETYMASTLEALPPQEAYKKEQSIKSMGKVRCAVCGGSGLLPPPTP